MGLSRGFYMTVYFDANNIYDAGTKAMQSSKFKHGTQLFEMNHLLTTAHIRRGFITGDYKPDPGNKFPINERGHPRYITSNTMVDKTVNHLLCDMGLSDKTPESYTQSISEGSQPSSKELQDFQKILEGHQVDMLINNVQKADDATNILTGTAHKSDVPVIDVTEQMPADSKSLISWIAQLIKQMNEAVSSKDDATSSDSDVSPSESNGEQPSNDNPDSDSDAATPDNTGQTDPGK